MKTDRTVAPKAKYKVRNWKEYNASLCKRGSLTLYIDPEILKEWSEISIKKKKLASEPILITSSNVVSWCD